MDDIPWIPYEYTVGSTAAGGPMVLMRGGYRDHPSKCPANDLRRVWTDFAHCANTNDAAIIVAALNVAREAVADGA